MEPGLNLGGPSSKAKYSLATDSERVGRPKGGKNRDERRLLNLKPCAYKLSEGYAPGQLGECLTACLLHNDPASYRFWPG